jgi:hypothetical protein
VRASGDGSELSLKSRCQDGYYLGTDPPEES